MKNSMPAMTTTKPRVSFVIPEDVKEDLEKLAAEQERSVSNLLLVLVKQAIEQAKQQGKIR